jgi:hypothetical protein
VRERKGDESRQPADGCMGVIREAAAASTAACASFTLGAPVSPLQSPPRDDDARDNGITALNFPKKDDSGARGGPARTTQRLFRLFCVVPPDTAFRLRAPFVRVHFLQARPRPSAMRVTPALVDTPAWCTATERAVPCQFRTRPTPLCASASETDRSAGRSSRPVRNRRAQHNTTPYHTGVVMLERVAVRDRAMLASGYADTARR